MQVQSPRIPSYRRFKVDDTLPAAAVKRRHKLETYRDLRAEGCSQQTALRAIGWSRPTYFRWAARYRKCGPHGLAAISRRPQRTRPRQWTPAHERQVWTLRRRYPFMGKRPLRVLLARQGIHLSESTVGRILAQGVRLGRIRPCAFCRGRVKLKKRRSLPPGPRPTMALRRTRATQPGQLVQIDHLSVSLDGTQLKEFRAVSPVGKHMVTRVYSRATARNARRFLQAVIEDLPFPLHSVQVDGGSEFRAEFEQACQQLDIPPVCPASPTTAVQWLRRTSQRQRPRRVLEPLHRRTHRRRSRRCPHRIPTLLQPPPTSPNPGHDDAHGVPCHMEGHLTQVSYVLNPHTATRRS